MASTDAIPVPRKNTAYRFYFAIRKPSDSTLITTWAGQDSEVSLDGAAFSDCTNEATEIGTSGCGYIDLTSSEMNADSVVLKVTVTNTGAVPLVFTFLPESAGDYRCDAVMISGDSVAADNLESACDNYSATRGLAGTALPNAAADAAGGLPISDAGGLDLDAQVGTKINDILADTGTDGVLLSTTALGAIWNRLTSSLTVVGSIGKHLVDYITGDIFARLGAPAGASIAADIASVKADATTLLGRITSARAGYLDNLNVGGAVASNADILALNQSASRRIILTTVGQYERPESGSTTYTIEARTYDGDGVSVNSDSDPTLTVTGQTTGSLAANVGVVSNPATGVYRWAYTQSSSATLEPIRVDVSATISSSTFTLSAYTQSVDFVSATWTTTDASNLTAIYNKLPVNNIADQTLLNAAIADVPTNAELTAALGTGSWATSLAQASVWTPTRGGYIDIIYDASSQLLGVSSDVGDEIRGFLGIGAADLDVQLGAIPTNAELAAAIQAAIVANHLDHLFATEYDPANKPGVSTALLNELIGSDAGVSQFTANSLELAPSGGGGGGDATLANQETIITHLEGIKGAGWNSGTDSLEDISDAVALLSSTSGPGADFVTITIVDDGSPVENVNVWISTDSAGEVVVAGTLTTNGSGQSRFLLTAGATYYLWAQKAGKIDIQGQAFVAVAD